MPRVHHMATVWCMALSLLGLSMVGPAEGDTGEQAPPANTTTVQWLIGLIKPARPDTVAQLDALAAAFHRQGKDDLATQYAQQALTIREGAWGTEHQNVAPGLDKLVELYIAQGKHAEAEPHLQRALAIREKTWGVTHPEVAVSLQQYATLLRQMQREAAAIELEKRAQASSAKDMAVQMHGHNNGSR